jgi:hypothetical protein
MTLSVCVLLNGGSPCGDVLGLEGLNQVDKRPQTLVEGPVLPLVPFGLSTRATDAQWTPPEYKPHQVIIGSQVQEVEVGLIAICSHEVVLVLPI